MAMGRFIHRDFFTSADLEGLGARGKLLFAGLIVYADDAGIIRHQPRFFRNTIMQGERASLSWIETTLRHLCDRSVITPCILENVSCWRITNFSRFQRLKTRQGKRSEDKTRQDKRIRAEEVAADAAESAPEKVDSSAWEKEQLDAWNRIARKFNRPTATRLTPPRKAAIANRLKETPELWAAIETELSKCGSFVRENPWLTLDWVLKPANLVKLLEGNYRGESANGKPRDLGRTSSLNDPRKFDDPKYH